MFRYIIIIIIYEVPTPGRAEKNGAENKKSCQSCCDKKSCQKKVAQKKSRAEKKSYRKRKVVPIEQSCRKKESCQRKLTS